jgi:hypothetical protein
LWEPVVEKHSGSAIGQYPELWAGLGTLGILSERIASRIFGGRDRDD